MEVGAGRGQLTPRLETLGLDARDGFPSMRYTENPSGDATRKSASALIIAIVPVTVP